jgi:hypothetical protein
MPSKVKNVAIFDVPNDVINRRDETGLKPAADFSTSIVAENVDNLKVVVEVDANGTAAAGFGVAQ